MQKQTIECTFSWIGFLQVVLACPGSLQLEHLLDCPNLFILVAPAAGGSSTSLFLDFFGLPGRVCCRGGRIGFWPLSGQCSGPGIGVMKPAY